jgi:hypothetical protein
VKGILPLAGKDSGQVSTDAANVYEDIVTASKEQVPNQG